MGSKLYIFISQGQNRYGVHHRDVPPHKAKSNKTKNKMAVLLHDKNFCAPTWKNTASRLAEKGYRVIIPDQVGFCKSSGPGYGYQFILQQLALNSHGLLDALKVNGSVTFIGHSMGGILATRYGLMYPDSTASTLLVNPIGLGVPYLSIGANFANESASTHESI